jgi:hypothetical protein
MRLYTCSKIDQQSFLGQKPASKLMLKASTCSASKASKQIEAPWSKTLVKFARKEFCARGQKITET